VCVCVCECVCVCVHVCVCVCVCHTHLWVVRIERVARRVSQDGSVDSFEDFAFDDRRIVPCAVLHRIRHLSKRVAGK
jgi:hypothetical protein